MKTRLDLEHTLGGGEGGEVVVYWPQNVSQPDRGEHLHARHAYAQHGNCGCRGMAGRWEWMLTC